MQHNPTHIAMGTVCVGTKKHPDTILAASYWYLPLLFTYLWLGVDILYYKFYNTALCMSKCKTTESRALCAVLGTASKFQCLKKVNIGMNVTVEVMELWTVFLIHTSSPGQFTLSEGIGSLDRTCNSPKLCISEPLSEGIFLISWLFQKYTHLIVSITPWFQL